jgi:hypothetical protein
VWLAIALSLIALGLVLVAIAALSARRRFKKMQYSGVRFTRRVGSLSDAAALLTEQLATQDHLSSDE